MNMIWQSVSLALATVVALANMTAADAAGERRVYPDRWVYVSRSLNKDADVEDIRGIVTTAAQHGLNGMVLTGGFDYMDLQKPAYFRRLEEVKAICAQHKIEIIPILFSAGYGGGILGHDRNLAEGLPVENALMVVRGSEARHVANPPVQIVNGGFEEMERSRFKGYKWHDEPGRITFQDTQVFKEGRASLRIEDAGKFNPQHGHGRIMQEVTVAPHRCYRLSCWVKTEGLKPANTFKLQVLAGKHALAPFEPRIQESGDWQKITMAFNSLHYDRVRIYAGLWGGKEGKLWLDDLRLEEVGPINVLRRSGTPVVVRSEDGKSVYEEGKDYAPLEDPKFRPSRPDHDAPPLKLLSGSRIRDGERLRVSWYHALAINDGQVSVCMSEPKTYDIWRTQAELLRKHLAPKKFLLSMDEIRAGGSCAACKARKMTMAQILGDCITRQMKMLRETNLGAEIYCWSDMLDPNHNAHGDYYLVDGDFTGSWNHVPKDLIIVCWYFKVREASLKFFSEQGFRTLAGAYYDGDTLDNPRGWLETLDRTTNVRGIMYTTWRNKYELLAPFGDLVSKR